MKKSQWESVLKTARGEVTGGLVTAFIVDSPWIPGFVGVSTVDYIADPDVWLQANLAVLNAFPTAVFLPGFWVEPGMAAEPSGFGCRIVFSHDQPPSIHPLTRSVEELASLEAPNPRRDGLMPIVLSQYRRAVPRVREAGFDIRIAAARGPLALAAHLLGLTDFLVALKTDPQATHRLMAVTTRTVKTWLEAQLEALPGGEGIMVLDDVMGFLSRDDYLEFAHPYLMEIFSLPVPLKILHNDNPSPVCYEFVHDLGVDVFNFSHQQGLNVARRLVGDQVCLMGNVPPLDVLVNGTAEETAAQARHCIEANAGHPAIHAFRGRRRLPGHAAGEHPGPHRRLAGVRG